MILYAYVANGGTLGEPAATITYGYEAEHQAWADQLTSYNGEAIRYDASGNPTTYRGYTMMWQGRRLTGATDGTTTTAYTYDENGIRTQKTVNGTATQYRYHGSVLISQVTANDTLLFSYDANGNVVAVNYNGTYYYYVRNGQNDVIRLIDGNNNTVVEYSYDSWGKPLSTTGTLASTLGAQNPFRYRGYIYDTETGLYYLQTRYYDPEVGRFINADIYVSTGQGVLGNNMYLYCGNNPIVRADDEGDFWNLIAAAVVVAVTVVVVAVSSGISETASGGSFWAGAAGGAVAGAISSIPAAVSVATGCLPALALTLFSGAYASTGSLIGYTVTQSIKGEKVNNQELIRRGVGGFFGGLVAGGLSGQIGIMAAKSANDAIVAGGAAFATTVFGEGVGLAVSAFLSIFEE